MKVERVPLGFETLALFCNYLLDTAVRQIREVADVSNWRSQCPKFVTHADPHLDEVCAMLLTRARYAPGFVIPCKLLVLLDYELTELDYPELRPGTVVFGIANAAKNIQGITVFDEHALDAFGDPIRVARSTTELVYNKLIAGASNTALQWLVDEVSEIDDQGLKSAGGLHLSHVVKDVACMRVNYFTGPRQIQPLQLEAVIASAISNVVELTSRGYSAKDNSALLHAWMKYLARNEVPVATANEVTKRLKKDGNCTSSLGLSMANVALAVSRRGKGAEVSDFIMDTIFSALLQAQIGFELALATPPVCEVEEHGFRLICCLATPEMPAPHRAKLFLLNRYKKDGMVVARNQCFAGTAVFFSTYFPTELRKRICEMLQALEPMQWFPVPNPDRPNFVLNRTLAHQEVAPTCFQPIDFEGFFRTAVLEHLEMADDAIRLNIPERLRVATAEQ